MKNKKVLAYAVLPVLGLSLLSAQMVLARGLGGNFNNLTPDQIAANQQTMFQNEANLLGLDVSKVIDGWAQGQTIQQIAQANGLTQAQIQSKMQANQLQNLTTQLQTLVSKGIITQTQADARLKVMQTKMTAGAGKMAKRFGRTMGLSK